MNIKPGQKLCRNCYDKELEYESTSTDDDFENPHTAAESLDTSSSLLGCSPVKVVSERDKVGYGIRKIKALQAATKTKLAEVLNVPTDELETCEQCKDLEIFVELLKEKCHSASRKEKMKLLSLVPSSWSILKTMEEFNVSEHMVKRAREVKKTKGILGEPDPKKGKCLSPEVVARVIAFYQSDEYSRMCPGKKEFVSVRIDGKKEQMQKRLLLVNLKELHLEYIKSTGDKIGFSKFCDLRPKWCVSVNSKGMHSVCVCVSSIKTLNC